MYGSAAEFATYCEERGYDISALSGTSAQEQQLRRASAYVDGLGYEYLGNKRRVVLWSGQPLTATQEREWPRTGATDVYGNAIASAAVPTRIEHATYEAAFALVSGVDLNRSQAADQVVTREKIDVLERQFAEPKDRAAMDTRPVIPAVADLIAPLINNVNSFGITQVIG